jgi:hypothetical protein
MLRHDPLQTPKKAGQINVDQATEKAHSLIRSLLPDFIYKISCTGNDQSAHQSNGNVAFTKKPG